MSNKFYVEYDTDWRVWMIMQSEGGEEHGLTYDTAIANSYDSEYAEKIASLLNKYADQW